MTNRLLVTVAILAAMLFLSGLSPSPGDAEPCGITPTPTPQIESPLATPGPPTFISFLPLVRG